jgi:hypothetical protein
MEIWKPVVGFEGYEVSNLGRVRSLDRVIDRPSGYRGNQCKRDGQLLTVGKNNNGYTRVGLTGEKGLKTLSVHRLVAKAFIENPENKPTVNHVDGDKTNNNVENLEWATILENNQHAYVAGLKSGQKGSRHPNAIITPEIIQQARILRENGNTYASIGLMFGVHRQTIADALTGRRWKHLNE